VIDAIVFDFDGLILETEMPSYLSWRELFERFGCQLTEDEHVGTIGTHFDRLQLLRERATVTLPTDDELRAIKLRRHHELLAEIEVLPGVLDWLDAADRRGLPLAIASSSPDDWVIDHLERIDLRHRFRAVICCGDDLPRKPEPDAYLAACDALAVEPSRALAVEDSANGIAAAKTAGLWCVAVPNPLTRRLDLGAADVQVASLAEITLDEVLERLTA
jgi:HAD superfamily hydrolase (TIGR01509 family)